MFRRAVFTNDLAGMGALADGETNPDGSPTYDGAPYDPNDPANPYNQDYGVLPTSIPLSTTSMGPTPNFTPPPLVNYQQPPPIVTAGSPTLVATGAPSAGPTITSVLQSLFGGAKPAVPISANPFAGPLQAGVAPSSALTKSTQTSTLLLLGVAGFAAFLLLRKKRAG